MRSADLTESKRLIEIVKSFVVREMRTLLKECGWG
jgi:hypothetical protein